MEELILLIGKNLLNIRKERNLSLDQVSELTGVSKGMLAQIEKGKKTPSVTTMWKIASGLKLSISDLMKAKQPPVKIISLDSSEMLTENMGKYRTGSFLPFDGETRFEVLKMDLEASCVHKSSPHGKGVKEYVFVMSGTLEMEIENNSYTIKAGEAIIFEGDVAHTYINKSDIIVNTFILIYYSDTGL